MDQSILCHACGHLAWPSGAGHAHGCLLVGQAIKPLPRLGKGERHEQAQLFQPAPEVMRGQLHFRVPEARGPLQVQGTLDHPELLDLL